MIDPETRLAIKEEIQNMNFGEKQIEAIEHAFTNVFHREMRNFLAIQERHSTILAIVGGSLAILIPVVASLYMAKH